MDVSGWTVDQRMRMPDYCFGNRKLYICNLSMYGADTWTWKISSEALPDPACIWAIGLVVTVSDYKANHVRIGLRDTLPESKEQMDTCQNILPCLGDNTWTPPKYNPPTVPQQAYHIELRMGLLTSRRYFVAEGYVHENGLNMRALLYMVVSGLPTSMAGWLAHNK